MPKLGGTMNSGGNTDLSSGASDREVRHSDELWSSIE